MHPVLEWRAPWARALRIAALAAAAAVLASCGDGDGDGDQRGEVVEASTVQTQTRAQIDASVAEIPFVDQVTGGPAQCDVTLKRIVYRTIGPGSQAARASAALLLPSGCPGPYPTLLYHHGTTFDAGYTTSDPDRGETRVMAVLFAAHGYAVVMPDYHGYGASDLGYHPYLHAESSAAVSVDALRAARRVLEEVGVATTAKLFVTGYSQGGHAAMATQRAIERDHASEFAITAAVPMSGPYSITRTFLSALDGGVSGAAPFVAMAVTGYQRAYGDVYARPGDVFRSPYAATIEGLLPSTIGVPELEAQGLLPPGTAGAAGLITDAFAAAFRADPSLPARRRAAENDLLDWTPRSPTALCGGSRDPVVPFDNTRSATAAFALRGATVPAIDIEADPRFQFLIALAVQAAPDLSTYHAGIAAALCLYTARFDVFDPMR